MSDAARKRLPIGVFDSGVGGLTVLNALRSALPAEHLVYLGDTARLPYGTKSPASIRRYAARAAAELQDHGIKALVVACNTASAVALETLAEQMRPVPVIGVVEPGAAAAVSAHPGGSHLVLATEATVRLGAYRGAIGALDRTARVRELACELLVALAEEGWTTGPIAQAIVARYLDELARDFRPDTIILGCTHFPLLRDTIAGVAGPGVGIVDSASTTAARVRQVLETLSLGTDGEEAGSVRFFATDGAARFARVGSLFLGSGHIRGADVTLVDL